MIDDSGPMTHQDAKALEAALEVVKLQTFGPSPFQTLTNAHRDKSDPPAPWTAGFSNLFTPPPPPKPPPPDETPVFPGTGTRGPDAWHRPPAPDPAEPDRPRPPPGSTGPLDPALGRMSGGKGTIDAGLDKAVRVVIVGHQGQPVPVFVLGGKAAYERDQEQRAAEVADRGPNPRPDPAGVPGGRATRRAEKAEEAGVIARTLARHFALLFGPLAAFGTILGQTSSGFGVFRKSIDVVASSLAPLLLPVFVLLAAGLVALSDTIWARLLPALAKWYGWVNEHAVPAAEQKVEDSGRFLDGLRDLGDLVTDPAKAIDRFKDDPAKAIDRGMGVLRQLDPTGGVGMIEDNVGSAGDAMKWFDKQFGDALGGRLYDEEGRRTDVDRPVSGSVAAAAARSAGVAGPGVSGPAVGGEPSRPGDPGTGPATFRGATRDVLRSLQLSIGPKASYGQLQDVGRQAQLAALNQDPLDARTLLRTIEAVQTLLQQIERNTDQKPDPTFKAKGR